MQSCKRCYVEFKTLWVNTQPLWCCRRDWRNLWMNTTKWRCRLGVLETTSARVGRGDVGKLFNCVVSKIIFCFQRFNVMKLLTFPRSGLAGRDEFQALLLNVRLLRLWGKNCGEIHLEYLRLFLSMEDLKLGGLLRFIFSWQRFLIPLVSLTHVIIYCSIVT